MVSSQQVENYLSQSVKDYAVFAKKIFFEYWYVFILILTGSLIFMLRVFPVIERNDFYLEVFEVDDRDKFVLSEIFAHDKSQMNNFSAVKNSSTVIFKVMNPDQVSFSDKNSAISRLREEFITKRQDLLEILTLRKNLLVLEDNLMAMVRDLPIVKKFNPRVNGLLLTSENLALLSNYVILEGANVSLLEQIRDYGLVLGEIEKDFEDGIAQDPSFIFFFTFDIDGLLTEHPIEYRQLSTKHIPWLMYSITLILGLIFFFLIAALLNLLKKIEIVDESNNS